MDVEGWYAALEKRHLASLTFPEVRRALQSLSTLYVGKREKIAVGGALDGAGKRAAFALFYGPLHFLTVRAVLQALGLSEPKRVVDLGCGTGVAGAAWALATKGTPTIVGIDTSGWAITEAAWNARVLGVTASYRRGDLTAAKIGASGEGVIAAYAVNELEDGARDAMRKRLLDATKAGSCLVVIEPIAKRPFPWWGAWEKAFLSAGGRADIWRFPAVLPERMKLLDKAAGLDHRELTARSLSI